MNTIYKQLAIVAVILLISLGIVLVLTQPVEEVTIRSSAGYGWIREEEFTVTATGSAGAATGSKDSDGYVRGHVYAVYLDYATTISTTTDFTLTTKTTPTANALILTNYYTDTWYYPVVQQTDSAGSGTSTYDQFVVSDRLTGSIAQSTATDVVTVTVYWGQ